MHNYGIPVRVEHPLFLCSRSYLYLGFLLAIITAFHVATVREGHLWGDDFAMYIHHAQNIAESRPYADAGYIYNPAIPVYGPRMYPPVFPLLLAPLYKVFGLSLLPMKLEQVFFIISTLALIFMLWHRELGTGYCLALVGILGFNPAFWWAKENILSDLPFLLFSMPPSVYCNGLHSRETMLDPELGPGRHALPCHRNANGWYHLTSWTSPL